MTREDVARALFVADNKNASDPEREWWMAPDEQKKYAYDLADAVMPLLKDAWNDGMVQAKLQAQGIKGPARNPYDPPFTHVPCCSSHGVPMTCERYRRTHFVEVGPCCEHWKETDRDGA